MKRIILFVLLGLVIIGLGIGLYVGLSNNNISPNAESYVSISINPAVEFTINGNDQVISVISTDIEGDEIVQSFDFYGMNIDKACEKFTQLCIEAGYVNIDLDEESEDTNEVIITVVNNNQTIQNRIRNRIRERVEAYFANNGIFGKVSEDTLNEYLDEAIEYELPVGHIKLIMRALEFNPEFTFEEIKDFPINEIVAMVKEKHQNMRNTINTVRQQLKDDLDALKESEEYEEMFALLSEIKSIENQLKNDELTDEQIVDLETQLENKENLFEENYSELYEQYKEGKKNLIEQAKEDSKELIVEIKNQYKNKVNQYNNQLKALKNRMRNQGNNIKNRIKQWQTR